MGSQTVVDVSVALAPCDLENFPSILNDIKSVGDRLSHNDRGARLELLDRARSLVQALETPRETMIKHCWAQPANYAALAFGVQIGLFTHMAQEPQTPKKVDDLATQLGVENDLLRRMMRHIGAMGYIKETGPDEYKATNFSNSLTIPIIYAGYTGLVWSVPVALGSVNEYLKEKEYKTPTNPADTIYQYAHKTDKNFFEHLQSKPPHGELFNYHMGGYRQGRPSWMDAGFYPVQENLVKGFDSSNNEAALLVDIGGSIGHDLDEFQRKFPEAPGRLVLQDLPTVIGQITDLNPKIERQSYDFYEEQPVKGARAYYMHSVLHDWPDDTCMKIVERIKQAMKPGYSKILINENVIAPTSAAWEATGLDLLMLSLFSARERTESDWRQLLEQKCGLKISKIWTHENGVESVIECELA